MAQITFKTARDMTISACDWLQTVSNFIKNPSSTPPTDLYPSQKLAFEIDKSELTELLKSDRVIGILGKEMNDETLSVILVGVDENGNPSASDLPCEIWSKLCDTSELSTVLNNYLTPQEG